jgi:hypothetical protein
LCSPGERRAAFMGCAAAEGLASGVLFRQVRS